MSNDRMIDILAERILDWRVAPGRFLIGSRRWIPRWRFQPFTKLEDAFLLLDRAGSTYSITGGSNGLFTAHVVVGNRTGMASGDLKASCITLAVARAIGLVPDDQLPQPAKGDRSRHGQSRGGKKG